MSDPLAPAINTAHQWLAHVADHIGTDDHVFAYQLVRAWLHTVRDRLTVVAAAHLSAQLPEFWRGVFFEGWTPGRVPVGHRASAFIEEFADATGLPDVEVPAVVGTVTSAFDALFSPGQLDHVFAVLPVDLCSVLTGLTPEPDEHETVTDDPLARLEERVRVLGDAVAVLARGLEDVPFGTPGSARRAEAAQQAHRLLLAQGLTTPNRG